MTADATAPLKVALKVALMERSSAASSVLTMVDEKAASTVALMVAAMAEK